MRISNINANFQPLQQNINSFLNVLQNKIALVALACIAMLGSVAFFVFRYQFRAKKQEHKEVPENDKKEIPLDNQNQPKKDDNNIIKEKFIGNLDNTPNDKKEIPSEQKEVQPKIENEIDNPISKSDIIETQKKLKDLLVYQKFLQKNKYSISINFPKIVKQDPSLEKNINSLEKMINSFRKTSQENNARISEQINDFFNKKIKAYKKIYDI